MRQIEIEIKKKQSVSERFRIILSTKTKTMSVYTNDNWSVRNLVNNAKKKTVVKRAKDTVIYLSM